MPYFQRAFASVVVIFVLLCSVSILPETVSAKRCGAEIPDSLLTLYQESDLIVVASIKSEKVLKITDEYEYGKYLEVEKSLEISDTLKGRDLDSVTFNISAFKSKNTENTAEYSEDGEIYPKVGDKALFFLTKNAETNFYELADYSSGMKKLKDVELDVYEKRIKELKQIVANKKNQLPKLTEWLVRLTEEPITRTEGVIDLEGSFTALQYAEEEQAEIAEAEEDVPTKEPILLDKGFRADNTPEIAKLLTDSQKQRLSNVFLLSLNEHLAKLNDADGEEEITPDYELISLTKHWDKTYLAMTSFTYLQNTDSSNGRKVSYLMSVVALFLDDEKLYEISGNYASALSEDENTLTEVPKEEVPVPETMSESETSPEVEPSVEIQKVEEVSQAIIEETPVKMEQENLDESTKKPVEEITYKQYKEIILLKFNRQYGTIISQISASK
ncbi:MAG: hypothetical protein M3367_16195 [Acidobacteriota bacterium]|nr:hypothetical protein [Acidobacteriota bacterium]